ncbi:MAG: segregation/condensation protein A, partial [Candidatus Sumerlaeia bacterium]|nr:segregation/condensation protein A [Candidatus Sumerlaeia bacterium]
IMSYRIKLQIFDGPFDLLLYLIKVNEMDIYDIPIAEITRQYLDYIQLMQELNLDIAGEFLVMAATLIRLKCQQLLPAGEEVDREEEINGILSRNELIQQLLEYRRVKEMTEELKERQEQFSQIFYRTEVPIVPASKSERDMTQIQLDLQTLFYAFSRILPYVEHKGVAFITPENFTVEEKIESLRELLKLNREITFMEIVRTCTSRQELLVTFLALMELCRQREIKVSQPNLFGEIYIISNLQISA